MTAEKDWRTFAAEASELAQKGQAPTAGMPCTACPTPAGGEDFYLRGHALATDDQQTRERIVAAVEQRQGTQPFEALFRLTIQRALYTHWQNWGTEQAWPNYEKWHA